MDEHDKNNQLVKTSPDCGNTFSEKDIEGACNDCTNKVRNEETCFNAESVLQKEVVKKTGNIVKNSESSNPPIRFSDEPGDHEGHDYHGSSSVGHAYPGSSSARDSFALDDYQGSSSPRFISIRTSRSSHPGHDSWTSEHIGRHIESPNYKKQSRSEEEDRMSSFQGSWSQQSHNDNYHRGSSLHWHASECQSYHDYRYDDNPSSSSAGNAFHTKNPNRKRTNSEFNALTSGQGKDHHSSSRSSWHSLCARRNKRNINIFTNERNFRSGRVQRDDEFYKIRPSVVIIRRAERDEEPFDICSKPNCFASIGLSPPLQINETYKKIEYLMPGMFLLKKWLTEHEQEEIVKKCQELGLGKGGFFQPSFDSGSKMRLRMMCLGINWNHKTYRYEEIRAHDNAQPPPIPADFVPLVQRAIEDSHNKLRKDYNIRTQEELLEALPGLDPDVCIVNFYEENGRLGLHQDKDESPESLAKGLPVVSFSIGDTAEFSYGNERKFENLNKIMLESGDVLIFGGKSRLVFHGVSGLYPDTAPHWLTRNTSLRPGRLNLTFRQISI